jgi:excisionase family DNA binding protein
MNAVAEEWLNLSEAAEILGVHPSTVRLWADKGEIPTHRTAGGHRRFRRPEIETWAAARRDARQPAGQMIVQNALGRTRMQMAEGRLKDEGWYGRLDEVRRQAFRDSGRRLLGALMRHLADDAAALLEAKALGAEYERLGRAAGLSLAETVRMFHYFADFLYESVLDVYQASGMRAAREWAQMHRRVTHFTNAVLLALVEAHAPLPASADNSTH